MIQKPILPNTASQSLDECLRQRTFELQVLYDLSEQIGYTLNYHDLIQLILRHLNRAVPYAVAAGIVIQEEPHELLIQYTSPLAPTVERQIAEHIVTTLHRMDVSSVNLDDLRIHMTSDSMVQPTPPIEQLRSFFQVPLFIGRSNGMIGLLFIGAEPPDAFSEDQVRLLYTVANHASSAIQRLHSLFDSEEQRLHSLIEHLSDGVLLLDKDHRITLINLAAQEFLAPLTPTTVGTHLTHLGYVPLSVLLTPPSGQYGHEVTTPNASNRTLEVLPRPIADGRQAGGWALLIRDVTSRKRTEQELKAYAARLEQSNRDLEHYAFIASHDLQEPLNMITSFLSLIQRRYQHQLDAEADEFITYAIDGSNRMRQLINDLLDYSRIEKRGRAFAPVNVDEIVSRVLSQLQHLIDEHQITVTIDPLPMIVADGNQLRQVFEHLITNAITFRSTSHPPYIHISAHHHQHTWCFSVQDNGIGIEHDYHRYIFGVFKRLHTRDHYPGNGIGLAICQRIIERHYGSIWVESQPGEGTTFFFTIPFELEEHAL